MVMAYDKAWLMVIAYDKTWLMVIAYDKAWFMVMAYDKAWLMVIAYDKTTRQCKECPHKSLESNRKSFYVCSRHLRHTFLI